MINRICKWNAARYAQEDAPDLLVNLLEEELDEYGVAYVDNVEVDQLDALVDIIYIAIGGMWKMGLSAEQIEAAIHVVCDSNDSKPAKKTASHIKANIDKGAKFIPSEPRLQEILDARQ